MLVERVERLAHRIPMIAELPPRFRQHVTLQTPQPEATVRNESLDGAAREPRLGLVTHLMGLT